MKKITIMSATFLLPFSFMQAAQINLNGQQVNAAEWINKATLEEQLNALLVQPLEGSSYYEPVKTAHGQFKKFVAKQKTAQDLGHAVIKLDELQSSNLKAFLAVGLGSAVVGALIGYCLKG